MTQRVMKHKLWWNSNSYETKITMTQKVWQKKQIKMRHNCDKIKQMVNHHKLRWNTKCDDKKRVMEHKLWWETQFDETQIVIKHK